ncbi:hypothetical protein PRUPE_5G051400 [Prunus persica]|uniref:Wall-associated receptor kinase galacturonan-binding domain-containing protein n=1 Tax=Prunus persica TaxID=3760 RepID=A0A251P424_PRUPE|nr:hypothetical protein PRUPE_5G051400 [Prunus persica]
MSSHKSLINNNEYHIYYSVVMAHTSAPIANPNCTTHCGDVAIPYPFGIGPNKDCYLDECHLYTNNYSRQAPFLKSVNLELLSISFPFHGFPSVPVKTLSLSSAARERKLHQPQNLTGSPFNYSRTDNIFIAVSCDLFVRVSSDHETVAGCQSICRNTTGDDYNNCYEDWFENNLTNFQDLKDMGSVPVVLDWISNVHNYGERFSERFRENPDLTGNQSTPFCTNISTSSSDLTRYNRTRMICACPPGLEGNPYLLQPCQGTQTESLFFLDLD